MRAAGLHAPGRDAPEAAVDLVPAHAGDLAWALAEKQDQAHRRGRVRALADLPEVAQEHPQLVVRQCARAGGLGSGAREHRGGRCLDQPALDGEFEQCPDHRPRLGAGGRPVLVRRIDHRHQVAARHIRHAHAADQPAGAFERAAAACGVDGTQVARLDAPRQVLGVDKLAHRRRVEGFGRALLLVLPRFDRVDACRDQPAGVGGQDAGLRQAHVGVGA